MTPQKLKIFLQLSELKSFTKTAQMLGISQPAVSEHIQSLEAELGVPLFLRQGRNIELSSAGHCLVRHARILLGQVEEAQKEIRNFLEEPQGDLILGASSTPGNYLLPGLLAQFMERYPKIRPSLHVSSSRQVAEDLKHFKIELGLVGHQWRDASLEWHPFWQDEICLAISAKHPLLQNQKFSPEEVFHQRLLVRDPLSGTQEVVEEFLDQQGFKRTQFRETLVFSTAEAIKQALIQGMGVGFLSKAAMEFELQAGLLQVVPGFLVHRPLYWLTRKNYPLSPLVDLLLDFSKSAPR